MTGEGAWRQHPDAWLFFIPFILATAFTMLNLFIGVVVNAMQAEHEATMAAERQREAEDAEAVVLTEIRALRAEVAQLRAQITPTASSREPT